MKRLTRRSFMQTMAAAAAVGTLTACGGGGSKPASSSSSSSSTSQPEQPEKPETPGIGDYVEGSDKNGVKWNLRINGAKTAVLLGYDPTQKEPERVLTLPAVVEGYTITEIGSSAFADSKLREVTIPASVKVIGQWAFSSCENLTKVRILGAEKLGSFAFYFCTNLASVELGEKLTEIGSNAFVNCRPLKKIVFPKSLKKIGDGVFTASGLEGKLTLPENLVSVGEGAFSSLAITELILPDTLETVGSSAFSGLSIRKAVIPKKITSIESGTFSGCDQMEYVYIPKSVKYIESNAFGKGIVYDAFGTPLKAVYYGGDEMAWKNIAIEAGNEKLAEAEMHYGAKTSDLPQ